ncbi:MAG TPA: HD domain-containing phosphohydrolase [Thermoanaerobaculia bacterium]|nr:HD domain-containing phosphohydrolase [Thermoanaerobaculia bacterium]
MSERPGLRRPRLLWTLLGVMIIVAVVPLIVSHYFLIGINRDSLETLEKKYLTRSAVGIASDVENLVTSYTQQLKKIAGGMRISSVLAPAGSDPFTESSQTGLIATYTTADNDLLALRIVNRVGQGAAAQPAGLEDEVSREMDTALAVALKGQQYIGTFHHIDVVNQPAIVLAVPIQGDNGVIGAVEALVSLRKVSERVQEEGKTDVTAFIVDRGGQVLMHSAPTVNVERPDFSSNRIVEEFKKAPVRLTQSYEKDVSGEMVKMLGTVAPVTSTDWGVVVEKEQARAFASVDTMILRTVQWTAFAIALAAVLGTLFATGISRPIRALAERTQEIAGGNYQQRVVVRTRNEIGDLGHNFNLMSEEIEKAIEQLKKAASENQLLFINAVRMLAAAIDAKDPYTRGHSERVARYSIAIGKQLQLSALEMRNLRISALLHDVGKIGIDDRILRKPGALSDDEFEIMKTHPAKGAAIMSGVAQLIDIIPGMKYHHERWAGGGYPENLQGEMIPVQARIVAVADTFDAMTTNRPYQKAMDLSYVVEKIRDLAGNRFDPRVVEAFAAAVSAGELSTEDQIRGAA